MKAPTMLPGVGLTVGTINSSEVASISAGGFQTVTGSVEKTGAVPLGIVGFNINSNGGSGQSGCMLYKCYMYLDTSTNTHKYYLSFRNVATSAATKIYAQVTVLYLTN